jgi:endonuclease/exonuclease/phosphatase family metal-dependent hydrolase
LNKLRIATFNLGNFDDKPYKKSTLAERISVMRPQLLRLKADILCLQEVNGQEVEGEPRRLLALERLVEGTPYADYFVGSTKTEDVKQVYDERNLVILSRYEILSHQQYKHDYAPAPRYQKVTARTAGSGSGSGSGGEGGEEAKLVTWERPILYARVQVGAETLDVINLHLKSRNPSNVEGQVRGYKAWRTASGWAEGFFISAMKRVGQALEVRILIDKIFDQNENALIVACGDLNSDLGEVPIEAIRGEVPIEAIRGEVENTGNPDLAGRAMMPCELTVPESTRHSYLHLGKGRMLDHLFVSRGLLALYRGAEIHNELLHDESIAFLSDKKSPESDHAPVVAEFEFP